MHSNISVEAFLCLQGSSQYQFLRLQLTAGYDTDHNETLSYVQRDPDKHSKDEVVLPKDGSNPAGDDA